MTAMYDILRIMYKLIDCYSLLFKLGSYCVGAWPLIVHSELVEVNHAS